MTTKIAIVGAGLVGRSWAILFARAGHAVSIFDPVPGAAERALTEIEAALPDLEANDLLRGSTAAETRARLTETSDLAEALAGAVHVQESAPEDRAIKQALYRDMDAAAAPETVLASSTSALPASAFTEGLDGRDRCLVAHPINPPHLVPLVELVPAPWTAPDVVTRTRALMDAVGQAPITLSREIEGFVANRMQVALFNEAMRLVDAGICSVEDADTAIAEGIGLRWAFIGPFEVGDLNAPNGLRDYCTRFSNLFLGVGAQQAEEAPEWSPALLDKIEAARRAVLPASELGARGRWRDRRLTEIAVWKARMADNDD